MHSHFLVYLCVVASPSVSDILILSQCNVHMHEETHHLHTKHNQTEILKVCFCSCYTIYLTVNIICVCVRAAADNLISPV